MITTQDQDAVKKDIGAEVVKEEAKKSEPAPKAKEAPKVETIERPGSNFKMKAAIGYLALRLLDPPGMDDFKRLYPDIFE